MAHHATCAVPSAVFGPAHKVVVTPAVTYNISELVAATGSERRAHRLPASAHLATVIRGDAGTRSIKVCPLHIRGAQYAAILQYCRSRKRQMRGVAEAETKSRRATSPETRTESKAENRPEQRRVLARDDSPAETRAECRQRRDASRNRDAKRERENTSNDSLKLELVRRALLYRKSETAVVVLHMESLFFFLHEHANRCRKRRTSSAYSGSLEQLTHAIA